MISFFRRPSLKSATIPANSSHDDRLQSPFYRSPQCDNDKYILLLQFSVPLCRSPLLVFSLLLLPSLLLPSFGKCSLQLLLVNLNMADRALLFSNTVILKLFEDPSSCVFVSLLALLVCVHLRPGKSTLAKCAIVLLSSALHWRTDGKSNSTVDRLFSMTRSRR